MKNRKILKRLFWSCIYITFISYAIIMVTSLWEKFLIQPTVTTLVSSTYPVNEIPFPAVAVCNMNKISKKRAQNWAYQIANMTGRNSQEIMTYMKHLGKLNDFDFEARTLDELLDFQNVLDTLQISVIDLIREIAIPCEELLRSCYWQSVETDCSSIFEMQLTYKGYCCVFNHVGEVDQKTTDAGFENGLYVSVDVQVQDYYYTLLSSYGAMVQVFVPTDYPDKTSGGLNEILTQPNSENFIEIIPTTLISVEDVARYPVETRECLFNYERGATVQGVYSQSGCIVDCRIRSIYAICQCIPFMIPSSNTTNVCTLADIPCLNKFKNKWDTLFPDKGDISKSLERERHDSLHCEEKCYSPCAETLYEALANSFPIFL